MRMIPRPIYYIQFFNLIIRFYTVLSSGNIYPISSRMIPVIFNLNMRYKPMINEYIQFGLKSKYPFEYALQIILENAIIKYHEEIKWIC
jgi:hypothetical protein